MQVIHVPFYKRSIQYPLQAGFRAFIFFLRMKAHFSSENQMTQRQKNLVWRVKVDDCCLILFIQHIVIELSAECLVLGARCCLSWAPVPVPVLMELMFSVGCWRWAENWPQTQLTRCNRRRKPAGDNNGESQAGWSGPVLSRDLKASCIPLVYYGSCRGLGFPSGNF